MTGLEILTALKELNLPKDQYIVSGSCPMALAGIREAADIDLFVTDKLFNNLLKKGWQQKQNEHGDWPLILGVFDIHPKWQFGSYNPSFKELLQTADVIDGINIVPLEETKRWKVLFARPKDLNDIKLIDEYLAGK